MKPAITSYRNCPIIGASNMLCNEDAPPCDLDASDHSEQGWTMSHIIAHLTATLEDAAATAAMLARGVQVEQLLRFETPWQQLSTFQMVKARLQESHRMCRAFLDAWPDESHLHVTIML